MRNASGASVKTRSRLVLARVFRFPVAPAVVAAATAVTTGADTAYAYIDGSFDKHIGAVGSGGVIFYNGATEVFLWYEGSVLHGVLECVRRAVSVCGVIMPSKMASRN